MQNIVFIKSTPEIRSSLFTLGLDFLSVNIENTPHFMVITNQLKLMKQLAKKHNQCTIYTSDSRRQTFRLSIDGDKIHSTKLGTLKRSVSPNGSSVEKDNSSDTGASFLVVVEDNSTYHYIVE